MTYALITVCLVVFFYQTRLDEPGLKLFIQTWALIPQELFADFHREMMTLVSSQFLHGSLWHLVGNMWFLWLFGNNLEDVLGRWVF
ncbi:MAG: rhomboid family intramembrane serine protease, partial [Gloeomargarita sp. DG02_1_bins_92]